MIRRARSWSATNRAVMVGPGCASACEFFSYDMTIDQRAAIVGQYSSEGAGGSVETMMPEGIQVQLTTGRARATSIWRARAWCRRSRCRSPPRRCRNRRTGKTWCWQRPKMHSRPATPGRGDHSFWQAGHRQRERRDRGDLKAGTAFLEDKAREKYAAADFARPGTLTYTRSRCGLSDLVWAYPWCAKGYRHLEQNFKNIKLKFSLDGADVTDQMSRVDVASGGQQCRLVFTALSEWPGGEHHLTTTATVSAAINDGSADYPAGDSTRWSTRFT